MGEGSGSLIEGKNRFISSTKSFELRFSSSLETSVKEDGKEDNQKD